MGLIAPGNHAKKDFSPVPHRHLPKARQLVFSHPQPIAHEDGKTRLKAKSLPYKVHGWIPIGLLNIYKSFER